MKMHELKTIQPYFDDIWNGDKDFEIRKDDRGAEVGDMLWLREYDTGVDKENDCYIGGFYPGRSITARVKYKLGKDIFEGLAPGYCAMGIVVLIRHDPLMAKTLLKIVEGVTTTESRRSRS